MAPTLAPLPAPPRSAARPHTEAVQPPLASCAVRRAARHAEVARDAQVVAEGLRDALRRVLKHESAVHVFGRPGSGADLILASERPRLDDHPPTPVPLEARTS